MLLASEQLTISGGHKDTAQMIVHLLEKRALAPVDARRLTLRPFEGAGGVVTPSPLPATRAAFDAMRRGRPGRAADAEQRQDGSPEEVLICHHWQQIAGARQLSGVGIGRMEGAQTLHAPRLAEDVVGRFMHEVSISGEVKLMFELHLPGVAAPQCVHFFCNAGCSGLCVCHLPRERGGGGGGTCLGCACPSAWKRAQ